MPFKRAPFQYRGFFGPGTLDTTVLNAGNLSPNLRIDVSSAGNCVRYINSVASTGESSRSRSLPARMEA